MCIRDREKADSNAWVDEVRETAVQIYLCFQLDVLAAALCTPTFLTVQR